MNFCFMMLYAQWALVEGPSRLPSQYRRPLRYPRSQSQHYKENERQVVTIE
jgi:hypothetical protein